MNHFKHTLTRYAAFITWLLPDSLWRNKWLSLAVLATGFFGVAFQAQVFGLIIYYARHFDSGQTINPADHTGLDLLDFTLDPRNSIGLLAGGSLAVVILLALSAVCIYFSRRSILRLGRRYEEFCSKRVFHLLGQNLDIFSAFENSPGHESQLFRLVKSDSRFAGRVLRMLLTLFVPALTLMVALAVLVYLEAGLTLIIFALSGVFLVCQYRISKQTAAHSIRFEKLSADAGRLYKGLIQHVKQQPYPDENAELVEKAFARGAVKKQLDAYEGRLRGMETSRLASGLFMALVLGLIILLMGGAIIREGSGWGRLLVYVLALRFAMTNLQKVFSTLTAINRFYPQVRRYFLFVKSFEREQQQEHPPLQEYQAVLDRAADDILQGSSPSLKMRPGSWLALITPLELNRYTLADLLKTLLWDHQEAFKAALYSIRFATIQHSCPHCSLRRVLNLPHAATWDDIDLPQDVLGRLRQQLPKGPDQEIKPAVWENVEPEIRFALALGSALSSGCQWILLQEEGLHLLGQKTLSFFQQRLQNRISLIVFNNHLSRVGDYGEQGVAVMDEKGLIGLGSAQWFEAVLEEVSERLQLAGSQRPAEGKGVEDHDELDEEA